MGLKIVSKNNTSFTVQIEIQYNGNMLEAENQLQEQLNKAGTLSTGLLLEYFDTDGSPIKVAGVGLTSKGKLEKKYQTPYGAVVVDRYVYQTSKGGQTYVPLEEKSRVISTTTPKFAKMISSKYSCDAAPGVQRDLAENHGRSVALSYIKNITDLIGTIALAKEETWEYELPKLKGLVASISIGLDGTCLNMKDGGWREAMCGTIAFFDPEGNRMHTIYISASPEYGKEKFFAHFENEIEKIKALYPEVPIIGIADGAACNWTFLEKHCDVLTVDFWHVSEYLAQAAKVMFPLKKEDKERYAWRENTCERLKNKSGIATRILNELLHFKEENKLSKARLEALNKVITYFKNQKKRMVYHKNIKNNYPIGSGVTEAACKTVVKNRMCKGSAKWKDLGASVVLTLRSLYITKGRWSAFWDKYSQYGCVV